MYEHAYNDIKYLLGTQKKEITHEDTVSTLYCGQNMVTFQNVNLYGGDSVSVQWKDKTKYRVNMSINNIFKYALKAYACGHKFYASFQVRACTSA